MLGAAAAGRRTYLADSFSGIPRQNAKTKGLVLAEDQDAHKITVLNSNSYQRVRQSAIALGLDVQERVRFEVGYFNETLPALVAREPNISFSILRLDGDTYSSTKEALQVLYPRLSPGGFVVVDDWHDWHGCRDAVTEFRDEHAVDAKLIMIPHGPPRDAPSKSSEHIGDSF